MLPPETERLWQRLQNEPLLAGWYLIGGTALSLLIGHRQSEDLDFAWPGKKLPIPLLNRLIGNLQREGWHLERDDDANAYDEFLIAGMSLHDYQQNFIAASESGKVKLTFFSPDPPLSALLPKSTAPAVTIPPLPLLFQSKALPAPVPHDAGRLLSRTGLYQTDKRIYALPLSKKSQETDPGWYIG